MLATKIEASPQRELDTFAHSLCIKWWCGHNNTRNQITLALQLCRNQGNASSIPLHYAHFLGHQNFLKMALVIYYPITRALYPAIFLSTSSFQKNLYEIPIYFYRFFLQTRNYGALRAPLLLAPAPRGHCRFHMFNGPCPPKNLVLVGRPLKALRPLEGPLEARHQSGTTSDQCCGQKEPLEPKKISASVGL